MRVPANIGQRIIPVLIAVMLLFGSAGSLCAEGIYVRNYKTEKSSDVFKVYITGVGNGYTWASGMNAQFKQKELFCLPPDFVSDHETYIKIIDNYIAKAPAIKEDMPIELALLYGMQRSYPCNRK